MASEKYSAQVKHLRTKYVRLTIDFKPDELQEYKDLCKSNGTTATTEIKKFIRQYISDNKAQ
mgnify:CR=1 FL=1